MFVGVVNHWVALVCHKPDPKALSTSKLKKAEAGINLTKIYYLDSTNLIHLDAENAVVPDRIMDRVRQKIKLGLKATDKWTIKMTIQSFFDIRALLAKLVHIMMSNQALIGLKPGKNNKRTQSE